MTAHRMFWGKWGATGEERYELLAHLLDTAAAMDALVEKWLPTALLDRLSELVGADAVPVLRSAAALHDIGKATPYFQGQLLSPRSGQFAEHVAELSAHGFDFPAATAANSDERHVLGRHEISSSIILAGRVDLGAVPVGVPHIVNGHHGRWNLTDEYTEADHPSACRYYRQLSQVGMWASATADLRAVIADVLGHDDGQEVSDPAAVALLTSLVCLADWVASDARSIESGRSQVALLADNPAVFHRRRLADFSDAVPRLLGVARKPEKRFTDVFGFAPSRPVQRAMVKQRPPGLTVAMVPMGEGKTEAALGSWLESAAERQGMYFALPTMSTADAMFDRVLSLFRHVDGDVFGTLSHGRAVLNSFYSNSPDGTRLVSNDSSAGGLVPGDWFNGRHRALLAPVAVGTVDQLLCGVLRHKYGFIRLLAAAGKTVVLDEVHSYDPYMSELLCRLLEWLGHLRSDVILLSATLPKRRLRRYVAAYARGLGVEEPTFPDLPYPAVITLDETGLAVTDLTGETSGRETTVHLEYRRGSDGVGEAEAEVRRVRRVSPTAKIGVIVNTVNDAQELSHRLTDLEPLLLHSRIPAGDRASRVSEAIDRFGKHAPSGPDLLVATQVVEQSIDVDFDYLVTSLCPAPSLLQRTGRLWRHIDRHRPDGLAAATCVVVAPAPFSASPMAFLPYAAAEIHATWERALDAGRRTTIAIPGDVQALVDTADVTFDDLLGDRRSLVEHHLITAATLSNVALSALIPTPAQVAANPHRLADLTSGDLGNEETATRWSSLPSAVILPISSSNTAAWRDALPERPNRHKTLEILAHTIPVTGSIARRLFDELGGSGTVRSGVWDNRLLHDLLVVDIDVLGWLHLDPHLGLYATKDR